MAGDAIKGYQYENKICGLIALRLCTNMDVKDFKIGTNVPNLDPFDDVVINYQLESEDQPNTMYIQLKHKQNDHKYIQHQTLHKDSGDFSLVKYHKAFKKITKPGSKNIFWKGIEKGNERFILFTNSKLNSTKTCKSLQLQTADLFHHKLLSTKYEGQIYKLLHDVACEYEKSKEEEECFSDIEFSNKFLFFGNQSNEQNLTEKLKESIEEFLENQCHESKLDEIVLKYMNFVEENSKYRPLTKKTVINNLIWFYAESLHNGMYKSVDYSIINDWKQIIEGMNLIVLDEYDPEYVNVIEQCVTSNDNKKDYLRLHLGNIGNKEYLPEAWSTVGCKTILLETENTIDDNEEQFLKDMLQILVERDDRRLILICKGNEKLTNVINNNAINKFITLDDLKNNDVIMEKELNYYGCKTILREVITKDPTLKRFFKVHHLMKLLLSGLSIGIYSKIFPDYYDSDKIAVYVDPSILKCGSFDRNILCLSGDYGTVLKSIESNQVVNEQSLNNNSIITMVGEIREEICKLKEKLPNYNLFEVHAESDTELKLVSLPKLGEVFNVTDYVKYSTLNKIEKEVTRVGKQVEVGLKKINKEADRVTKDVHKCAKKAEQDTRRFFRKLKF